MSTMLPNIITSSPSGGRFDFDDGGTYCGGWQDGKAHGHGVCTGPKNVGEYSGSWNFGFEMSGVYRWTNGAVYEGRWQNGKRHGVGVEYNGKWIYKGEWSQGLKGRYGVKASSNSAVKYEGTWANGLQDGYGSETYSDGGYYQGQMCRGLRHGYGVRKSAPYGDSQLNNPSKNGPLTGGPSSMLLHANSIQSTGSNDQQSAGTGVPEADDDSPKPEDGFKPNIDRTLVSKNGFVLVSKPLDVPMPQGNSKSSPNHDYLSPSSSSNSASRQRRNSLTNKLAQTARIPNQTTVSLFRGLRLKKQKSTSDLDAISGSSGAKQRANQQTGGATNNDDSSSIIPFTLSPEELDITDPTTVETYMGEWKHDKRNGHGVCERSDGLKYEGQWHNDMKCGYGVTTFKDGTKEEGKYKNNILILDSKVKRFFQLGSSNIRQRIDEVVKMANQAATMALKKAEIADNRAATARDKADQAMTAAIEADRDSQIAYSVARQYSEISLQQQQQQQMMMFGGTEQFGPANNGHQFMARNGPQFMGTNLNLNASHLQMRRISNHQQRNQSIRGQQQASFGGQQHLANDPSGLFPNNQDRYPNEGPMNEPMAAAAGSLSANGGLVEPFNGRRGSFRGSSQPAGASGAQGASYSRQNSFRQNQLGQRQRNPMLGHHHQSADPFSDLFDHYKNNASGSSSSGYRSGLSGGAPGGGNGTRRGQLSKQTSLDYAQLRGASVPRQLGGSGPPAGTQAQQQRQRYRVSSSVDETDQEMMAGAYEQQQLHQDQLMMQQQMQLRHLVTSGEQLQQLQQQQQQPAESMDDPQQQFSAARPTPTNSSYILPQSSAAGSNSTTFNPSPTNNAPAASVGQQTPSPLKQSTGNNEGNNSNVTEYNLPQNRHQNVHSHHQRDVQSLADEQLYMADYRRRRLRQMEPLERTEYENYDFTITSGPRPTQRCRRRTASLTRTSSLTTPPLVASGVAPSWSQAGMEGQKSAGIVSFLAANQAKQSSSSALNNAASFGRSPMLDQVSLGERWFAGGNPNAGLPSFNIVSMANEHTHLANSSQANMMGLGEIAHHAQLLGYGLSPTGSYGVDASLSNSANSSAGAHNRKPSLQVRYDPVELGGLMSREEVAALSHAQREQKRIEAELAEKRAKQPLLHLLMSFKEFLESNKLILTVLIVNICLVRMFANLIA